MHRVLLRLLCGLGSKKNVWLESAQHQPPAALERRTSPLALPLSRALALSLSHSFALSLSRSPALSLSHSIALSLSLASIGCVFPACFDRSLARNEAKNRSGDAFSSVTAALERSESTAGALGALLGALGSLLGSLGSLLGALGALLECSEGLPGKPARPR